jgi:2-(1,2-epoxy-1,2-dihydrophenyl)acetyl-CoA isomerase
VTTPESPSTLLLDSEGSVLWLRLNRPEARNAINDAMRDELADTLRDADRNSEVRCLVITGSGRDFCTGGDLSASKTPATTLDYRHVIDPYRELFVTLWEIETPVVSAVNGTVAGIGWMLALLADLVVAAEGARWTHVFSRRGMTPHAGDPFFLPRLLPFHALNEIAMLSETITSERLAEWGVINRLVPSTEVEKTARELAERLAAGPTLSLGQAKRLYRRSLVSDMATSFAEEQAATAMLSTTEDRKEGMAALAEGRLPTFRGR